jgi:hypothetical protein
MIVLFSLKHRRERMAGRLKGILEIYGKGSGQLVNRDKSAIFFSKNCVGDKKYEVAECLNIPNEALAEKYLGLPTTRVKNLIGWANRLGDL